jgi:mannose-6-phosphate isomerase-like protein (cupin superfamily)
MKVVNRNKIRAFITKDKSLIREILHPKNSEVKNQSLAEAIVKPGGSTLPHKHIRSEEIYYILEGRGRVTVGEETAVVSEFDAILIPPGMIHYIENIGDKDLVFLCVSSPPYSHTDSQLCSNSYI